MASRSSAVSPNPFLAKIPNSPGWLQITGLICLSLAAVFFVLISFQPAASQTVTEEIIWRQFGPNEAVVGQLISYHFWLDSTPADSQAETTWILSIDLSTNVRPLRFNSGWFVDEWGRPAPVEMSIRYQTADGRWSIGPTWSSITQETPQMWSIDALSLAPENRLRTLEITLIDPAGGLRPASRGPGLPMIIGTLEPAGQSLTAGEEIRSCSTASVLGSAAQRPLNHCTRTTVQPPAAGTELEFNGALVTAQDPCEDQSAPPQSDRRLDSACRPSTAPVNNPPISFDQPAEPVGPPTGVDYGDGPEPFPAAWHQIVPGVSLGLITDGEPAPLFSFAADGDDLAGRKDEEGIRFGGGGVGLTGKTDNSLVAVVLNRSDKIMQLYGWIDFNRDGAFSDSERILFGHRFGPATNPQAQEFVFPIPVDARCGPTLARFRLTTDTDRPDGPSAAGEVEDIVYRIECVADIAVAAEPTVKTIGWDETLHWTISVTNSGPAPAKNIVVTQTIGAEVGYLTHADPGRNGWRCSESAAVEENSALVCQSPLIQAGEALTLDLAVVVPRRYPFETVTQTVTATTATAESTLANNKAVGSIEVDKRWVLNNSPSRFNYVFIHTAYDPNLTANLDLRERDFRLNQPIPNLIQVPISLAVGFHTGAAPWLTVPSCLAHPGDPTCNDNNRIIGQYILESYTISSITFEGAAVYEPEIPTRVFLNRVSDANMSRCAGRGSCVGHDLFRVERGGVAPYAWQAPFDYYYVNMITKGGREVTCPEGEYDERCIIIGDAKPGIYAINGTVQLVLVFEDVRLPDETLVRRARPIPFTAVLQILAPFIEPER